VNGSPIELPLAAEDEIQTPLIAKQPPFARLMPPVDWKVEVAVVKFAIPCTERSEPGVDVPMPMRPVFVTMKFVALEEPITN
jgi:hypothetical protein